MTETPAKTPLHERLPLLGWVRNPVRKALFRFLRKAANTDDGRAIATETLKGLLKGHPLDTGKDLAAALPYPELGGSCLAEQTSQRADVVFITARFRSGSTLLWNLFRHVEGVTSYYEPFNERRWFDRHQRGRRMDPSHRGVSDYWREYDGLQDLGQFYHESWTERHLYMDADFWDPDMKRYVERMIDGAPGRPVLQFNRIDFRLPWFRRTFPAAKIVHLYRHPRDQWCSSLMDLTRFPHNGKMTDFAPHDHFYLRLWARDLRYHFPFLDEAGVSHPYALFYFIWKLSFLMGKRHAHHSLGYEDLLARPEARLREMFDVLGISSYDLTKLVSLIDRPALGKWRAYADDEWFRRHESACETVLEEFG